MNKYRLFLLAVFTAVWFWAAWKPVFPEDWLLENILVFIFVPLIILLGFYFKFSDVSYTLITVFMILHVIGSHYTYAEVPFGDTLQRWLNADRNMYDRLVHFSFGLLLAYPVREVFMRLARVKGVWSFYLPFDVVLAFSGAFEIIEWLVASITSREAGIAYLGAQGDIWDAQKDMLNAVVGAMIAMFTVAAINLRYNRQFAKELRKSFIIPADDRPRGEKMFVRWRKKLKNEK